MPRLKDELQFPSMTSNPKTPLDAISIFNKLGKLYQIDHNGNIKELGTGGGGGGDLSGYYTSEQTDALLALKADIETLNNYFTQQETNQAIDDKIAALVDTAPGTLDTLNELAAALGDNPNFATDVLAQIALKANTADVYDKNNTYNRDEIDGKIPNMNLYYKKTETYDQDTIDNKFTNHVSCTIRDWSL